MLKRLIAAALLTLIASPAWATVNIRQGGDGTAPIVGTSGDSGMCLGGVNLAFPVQLNNVQTQYQVSPITNAVIKDVFGTSPGTVTGAATVYVHARSTSTTPVSFGNDTNTTITRATLIFGATSAGQVRRISTVNEVPGTATKTLYNTVGKYDYIAVSAAPLATGLVTAQVIVRLCPR